VEIRKFVLIEELSYRSNFILDALLNFEPVKRFKNWSDMRVLETARAQKFKMSWKRPS